jgi:phosphonate transport system substrate-binding protein
VANRRFPVARRQVLALTGAALAGMLAPSVLADDPATIKFALTPVFLTSDLDLLDKLRSYLEEATGRPVLLVTRRTYQEITAMILAGQVDGAWVCGDPYVANRERMHLVAVPIWNGRPIYQSYLIADASRPATSLRQLRGDIHAFSDPDSNSGYLVTTAELARDGLAPEAFFGQNFYTYGHRNVVRAVASGLAQSGSVDGYVYEVLRAVEPDLVAPTRIVRASDWFGFPPIACLAATANSDNTVLLTQALLGMQNNQTGRDVLAMLHLDRFSEEPPSLFDPIGSNLELVRNRA